MFNYPQMSIEKINQQIQELERLKAGYQSMVQQPINIYNNTNTPQTDFKAQFLNENQKVNEIFVNTKTAFIDKINGKLYIKETNGDIETIDLVMPKTKEQLRIEELERKINEYESRYEFDTTNHEISKSAKDDNGEHDATTKTNGRNVSKKPE